MGGSWFLPTSYLLVFGLLALGWLGLIYLMGWYLIVTYRPWHGRFNVWRLLLGSALQGLLGAQVLWGALFGGSVWIFFPRWSEPWLINLSESIATLALGPYWLAGQIVRENVPGLLAAGLLLYVLLYTTANLLGLAVVRVRGMGTTD
ncbi:MAG: hypothetical protein ACYC4L_06850 [Chloroflexota bacterium]